MNIYDRSVQYCYIPTKEVGLKMELSIILLDYSAKKRNKQDIILMKESV